jgi:hypothetical protein
MMTKIKEWPIVLTCSLHHWCRTPEWLAIHSFYSLDQLKGPEVMKMNNTQRKTINAGDYKRSDLPLFHERQGGGGEGAAVDGAGVGVHDLAGCAFQSVRAVAFEQSSEVAIGDHADQGERAAHRLHD